MSGKTFIVKLTGESFRFGIFLKLMVYNSVTVCFSDRFLQQKFILNFLLQGFPNSNKVWVRERGGGNWKFYWEGIFLPGEGNLRRSDFDNLNLFQNYKQLSLNTVHQLK